MKKKILILLVSLALLVGVLSGCTEETPTPTPANNAPTVTMDADPVVTHDPLVAGGTVVFAITAADEDEDDTLTYSWDFGDDQTSTEEDPTNVYAANGSYVVTVTVSDDTDEATATATVLVGNQAPVAIFSSLADNLTVTFTDESTDDGETTALTWLWDFDGDGVNTSTDQNPEFTYAADGTYTVTLTVTDGYGLTSTTDPIEITVEQEVIE